MKYNNKWLIEKFQSEDKIKFLFFWGHQPSKDGAVSSSCFSQWWPATFEVNGKDYFTAEHWMMAQKALLFNDNEMFEQIISSKTPEDAKKRGRNVKRFDPGMWDQHKFDIVVNGNLLKFIQHESLKEFLLQTGDAVLVEASPVDSIWGIGMAADNIDINNPLLWKGENLLGYALMEVRDKLNGHGREATNKN